MEADSSSRATLAEAQSSLSSSSCQAFDLSSISTDYSSIDKSIRSLISKINDQTIKNRDLSTKHNQTKRKVDSMKNDVERQEYSLKIRQDSLAKSAIGPTEEKAFQSLKERKEKAAKEIEGLKASLNLVYSALAECISAPPEPIVTASELAALRCKIVSMTKRNNDRRNSIIQKKKIKEEFSAKLSKAETDERTFSDLKNSSEEKIATLEKKKVSFLQSLSDPIDSLKFEESSATELESEAEAMESRYLSSKASENESNSVLAELDQKLNSMRQRKEKLQIRKESLKTEKKGISSSHTQPQLRNIKKLELEEGPDTQSAEKTIEGISVRLGKRYQQINDLESQIEKTEAEYMAHKKEVEGLWETKMKKLEDLRGRCKKIENVILSINDGEVKKEELSKTLFDLQQEVAQLQRKNQNAERDKTRNQGAIGEIAKLKQKIAERSNEIEEKSIQIQQRRKANVEEEQKMAKIEKELSQKEESVTEENEDVNKLCASCDDKAKEISEVQQQIRELLAKLPEDKTDQFDSLKELILGSRNV